MWMIFHKPSPVGMLTLSSDGAALTGLWLDGQKYFGAGLPNAVKENDLPVFEQASAWLDAYFAKAPLPALPPLAPQGSPFRQAVWRLLLEIPYGTVTTYGAQARRYPCPCCGQITLPVPPEEAVAYICPVCWWENDVFISSDNEPSDENHGLTLSQGRENVRRFGTCDPRMKR